MVRMAVLVKEALRRVEVSRRNTCKSVCSIIHALLSTDFTFLYHHITIPPLLILGNVWATSDKPTSDKPKGRRGRQVKAIDPLTQTRPPPVKRKSKLPSYNYAKILELPEEVLCTVFSYLEPLTCAFLYHVSCSRVACHFPCSVVLLSSRSHSPFH